MFTKFLNIFFELILRFFLYTEYKMAFKWVKMQLYRKN